MSKKLPNILVNRIAYYAPKNLDTARKVVDHLVRSDKSSIIVPFIDYPGPISTEILRRRFKSVIFCDPDLTKHASLYQYMREQSIDTNNVKLYRDDIINLSLKTHIHHDQDRCAELTKNAIKGVGDSSYDRHDGQFDQVRFLVPLLKSKYEGAFLKNSFYQMCFRIGLCSHTLIRYYFLASDRQCLYLNAQASANMKLYRSASILYNLIFNIKTLESFDLKSSFGISVRKLQKTSSCNNHTIYKNVHLLQLEPKLDVINTLGQECMTEFVFLVNQMMHKRRGLVINFLEKFFTVSLVHLESMGIDATTRCGDLDKEQYYRLFLYLKSREDYTNSIFKQAVTSNYEDIWV